MWERRAPFFRPWAPGSAEIYLQLMYNSGSGTRNVKKASYIFDASSDLLRIPIVRIWSKSTLDEPGESAES